MFWEIELNVLIKSRISEAGRRCEPYIRLQVEAKTEESGRRMTRKLECEETECAPPATPRVLFSFDYCHGIAAGLPVLIILLSSSQNPDLQHYV